MNEIMYGIKCLPVNVSYRISRSMSRVVETQNSSQKIDLDLYTGHRKYYPGVDYIFNLIIYLSLINKIKFEHVCLFKTCQNSVTTANHV